MVEMKQDIEARLLQNRALAGQHPSQAPLSELENLSRTSTRMDLCALCVKIDVWKMTLLPPLESARQHREALEHHKSYSDLCASALQGCSFCQFLRQMLLRSRYFEHEIEDRYPSQALERRHADLLREPPSSFFIRPEFSDSGEFPGEESRPEKPLLYGFRLLKLNKDATRWPRDRAYSSHDSGLFVAFQVADDQYASERRLAGRVTLSRPDLSVIPMWMDECSNNHPQCPQPQKAILPSRLLDCRRLSECNQIRLVQPDGLDCPYVALSHCWGSMQPLRTTLDNYSNHTVQIPFNDLPKTFRDAVELTITLGLRYLWIDSLCIVQDSAEDWERECARMADIYENALLTVAVEDAPDSSIGFLGLSQQNKLQYDGFRYSDPNDRTGQTMAMVVMECIPRGLQPSNFHSERKSRLSTRGWALQERLLSVRVLSFGRRRMTWECNGHFRSEDLHSPILESSSRSNRMEAALAYARWNLKGRFDKSFLVEKKPLETLQETADVYQYWNGIVSTYSGCSITHSKDKLPALSGLARRFASKLNDTYLAGIWKGNIHGGLLWMCIVPANRLEVPQNYQVPSWSWASIDGEVVLPPHVDAGEGSLIMCFISGTTTPKGLDRFGQVSGGSLIVCSYLRKGIIRCETASTSTLQMGLAPFSRSSLRPSQHSNNTLEFVFDDGVVAKLHLDHSDDYERAVAISMADESSATMMEVVAFLVRCICEDSPAWEEGYRGWDALAIEKLPGGQYRRLGVLHCSSGMVDECFGKDHLQIIELI